LEELLRFDWDISRENIKTVALGLGEMVDTVIFVGGSTLGFYVDNDPAVMRDIRGSEDVDIVVEVASRLAYAKLEDRLRQKGFANDTSRGAPICRWLYAGVKVDVMPTDPALLSFSNRWYESGARAAVHIDVAEGVQIKIMPAPYFVACKLEAFKGRGKKSGEYMFSRDLEDIVTLFDGRGALPTELGTAPGEIGDHLRTEIASLLADAEFQSAISAFIRPDARQAERTRRVITRMQTACSAGSGT
jgi:hypothetical protein